MSQCNKCLVIEGAIKLLIAGAVALWVFIIYNFAISGLPMVRQMLGCMLTTMAIFGILSFSVKVLKEHLRLLKNERS